MEAAKRAPTIACLPMVRWGSAFGNKHGYSASVAACINVRLRRVVSLTRSEGGEIWKVAEDGIGTACSTIVERRCSERGHPARPKSNALR